MSAKDVIENKEFKSILTILGLQLGVKVESPSDIRFGKIVFTTDQDVFGFSIRGLLMNMLYKFWPELYTLGLIYILDTPIIKVTIGKKVINFYSVQEYETWVSNNKKEKFTAKFFKGLGTSKSDAWREYFTEESMKNTLSQIRIENDEDREMFKLLFSKEKGMTDQRKDWMDIADKTDKELV
jgi:DNA topoisomerase-2